LLVLEGDLFVFPAAAVIGAADSITSVDAIAIPPRKILRRDADIDC
jgi:hypothetical protein